MSTSVEKQVQALQKTQQALAKIKNALKPFLVTFQKQRDDVDGNNDPYKHAEVEAAVSLSIGTLRYMAAKLNGCSVKNSDPLRMELNKMRKMLQSLKKSLNKSNGNDATSKEADASKPIEEQVSMSDVSSTTKNSLARHHVLDLAASERMVKAALHESSSPVYKKTSSLTDPVIRGANEDVSTKKRMRSTDRDGEDDEKTKEVDTSTSPAPGRSGPNGSKKRNKKKSKKRKKSI